MMSQKDGANYVVLYQMLCLKTINTGGRFSRTIGEIVIPYDVNKIQRDCKWFSLDTIRVALELYKRFGLVYEEQDGTLVITDHHNLVGSETDFAQQKRDQKIEKEKAKRIGSGTAVETTVDSCVETGVENFSENFHTDIRDKILDIRDKEKRGEDTTTTSTTDISSSLSPKENIDIESKDSQDKQSSKVKDGMSRFTAQMEKPTTAAEYLIGMGIDLGDYFIAEQYRDFLNDGMEESAIMYAASLAKSINKVSWSYIKAILNRWMVNGIKTRAQAEEEEKSRGKESEVNGNGRYSDHRRKNHEGPRTDYGLKPRFAGHRYDADGNDITGKDGT